MSPKQHTHLELGEHYLSTVACSKMGKLFKDRFIDYSKK